MPQPHTANNTQLLEHTRFLRALARSLVRPDEVEDMVQDTMLTALRQPQPPRLWKPWLGQVLRNNIRMRFRSDRRRETREKDFEVGVSTPTLDESMTREELLVVLRRELDALDEPFRSTLQRRFYEGISAAQIARSDGLSAGTVRWRIHEGLRRLRLRLDDQCEGRQAWFGALVAMGFDANLSVAINPKGTPVMKTLLVSTLALSSAAAGGGIWMLTTSKVESSSNILEKDTPTQLTSQSPSTPTHTTTKSKATLTSRSTSLAPPSPRTLPVHLPDLQKNTPDPEGAVCNGPDEDGQENWHEEEDRPCDETQHDFGENFDKLAAGDKRIDFPTKGLPHQGADPRTAKAKIIQCSDFDCPYCVKANTTMEELLSHRNDVTFYFVHSPLKQHETARMKAQAATAAQKQGKFWVLHDALYENKTQTLDDVVTLAESLGLDGKRLRRDMEDPATDQAVEAQTQLCRDAGAKGTPAFFINGVFVPGARPIETFEEILDRTASEGTR